MTLRRLIGTAVVIVCVAVPLVEAFDRWDATLQDGNDTEENVVIAALCVGLALSLGTTIVTARIRAVTEARIRDNPPTFALFAASIAAPVPTGSPPAPLRI